MNVAHARETLKIIDTAVKGHILTEDDLNRIDAIILSRMEEEIEKNDS
jgi:hypothetical protein